MRQNPAVLQGFVPFIYPSENQGMLLQIPPPSQTTRKRTLNPAPGRGPVLSEGPPPPPVQGVPIKRLIAGARGWPNKPRPALFPTSLFCLPESFFSLAALDFPLRKQPPPPPPTHHHLTTIPERGAHSSALSPRFLASLFSLTLSLSSLFFKHCRL